MKIRTLLRTIVYASLFLVLAGVIYWKYLPTKQKSQPSAAKVYVAPTIEDVENSYRLQPDRRFLLAISDIDYLLTKRPVKDPEITFKSGKWVVRYQEQEVGSLPEIPGFLDMMPMLISFAKQFQAKHPIAEDVGLETAELKSSLDKFDGFNAVKEVDRIWQKNPGNTAIFPWAARSLTIMKLQTLDKLGIADNLAARALATTAISIALSKENMDAEQCLLAADLHYFSDAEKIAGSLPSDHAVQHFVLRNRSELDILASENKSRSAAYLRLLLDSYFRSKHFDQILEKYFGNTSSLSLMRTMGNLETFDLNIELGRGLIQEALKEVQTDNNTGILKNASQDPTEESDSESITEEIRLFEETLRDHAQKNGMLLDTKLYDSYYRAFFYSGLFLEGIHYKDYLGSVEATEQFASELAELKSGVGADFKKWYTDLALFTKGSKSTPILMEDLEQLKTLGHTPLLDTLMTLNRTIDERNPKLRTGIKKISKRLDSRPEIRELIPGLFIKSFLILRARKNSATVWLQMAIFLLITQEYVSD